MSEWISVKYSYPNIGQLVIFSSDKKNVFAGRYNGDEDWEIGCACILAYSQYDFSVTHWMPLPEPPKDA